MVTVFVAALGLLSVAALQLVSKRNSYEAEQRTTASALIQDIIERIRANPGQRANYVSYDATERTEPSPNCLNALCSATQIVAFDLWQWGQALQGAGETDAVANTGGLADPTACIVQGSNECHYSIAIAWRGVSPQPQPVTTSPLGEGELNSCGVDNSAYDDPESAGNDFRLRRTLVISTFINDPDAPPCN